MVRFLRNEVINDSVTDKNEDQGDNTGKIFLTLEEHMF